MAEEEKNGAGVPLFTSATRAVKRDSAIAAAKLLQFVGIADPRARQTADAGQELAGRLLKDQGLSFVNFMLHIFVICIAKVTYADSSYSARRRSTSSAQTWRRYP
ncbi:MAG: hypothetical protein OXC26_16920 [Albidovulum sp.]|nr:hypothetical protein [Albidovulum sp.]